VQLSLGEAALGIVRLALILDAEERELPLNPVQDMEHATILLRRAQVGHTTDLNVAHRDLRLRGEQQGVAATTAAVCARIIASPIHDSKYTRRRGPHRELCRRARCRRGRGCGPAATAPGPPLDVLDVVLGRRLFVPAKTVHLCCGGDKACRRGDRSVGRG
jgi:hypothetical protein